MSGIPCWMGMQCRNSPDNAGEAAAKCGLCRLSVSCDDPAQHFWHPVTKGVKHPTLEQEKRDEKRAAAIVRAAQRHGRDRGRQKTLQRAAHAEKRTEAKIIRATRNSGRVNQDGDHLAAGSITLDTKHQSQREHPVVRLEELTKVNEDARRAGTMFGALVLRPKNGSGVVALWEDDFARLLKILEKKG